MTLRRTRARQGRTPRVETPGITIDGPTSRDLDDAIWLEGDTILVTIADVASAVPIGGDVDRMARSRAFTRYLPRGNRPMIAHHLSEGSLSLREGEPRETITTAITLDAALEIADVRVERTRLTSLRRFDHAGADRAIRGDEPSPHAPILVAAWELARGLLRRRRARGSLAIYDLEHGWRTTEEGRVVAVGPDDCHWSNVLVQEFMILANAALAGWLIGHGVPSLFRNHEATPGSPDRDALLAEVQAALDGDDLALVAALREGQHRLFRRATYGPEARGHHGLNLPAYCHATSPIRRYADLVVQRVVSAILDGAAPPYSVDDLAAIGDEIAAIEGEIKDRRRQDERDKAYRKAAEGAMNENAIDRLGPNDFRRVIKLACAERRLAPLVAASALRRLGDDSLPLDDLRWLLLGLPARPGDAVQERERVAVVHRAILDHIRARPHLAPSILSAAQQDFGLPAPGFDETRSGPGHDGTFEAVAALEVDGRGLSTTPASSRSRKEARQLACVNLLALLVGLPEPVAREAAPPPPVPRPAPPVDANPIGVLNERCQALRSPAPAYSFAFQGEAHRPRVACTAHAFGREASAEGSSKQEAKRLAAAALLEMVRADPGPGD